MDDILEQTADVVENVETEIEQTGAVEESGSGETAEAAAPVVPAYQPNLKFKSNNQELEFDELFRPLVVDEATEKKIREFHEKFHGIDGVKKHRDEIREKFESYRSNFDPILENIKRANLAYEHGDMDTVLAALGVDENKMLHWAKTKEAISRLSPEARAEYDRQRQTERENLNWQQQAQTLQSQVAELGRQRKVEEINAAINAPNVIGVQQAFDQRKGDGAFRRELIRRGLAYEASGDVKSANQVAAELVDLLGGMQSSQTVQPQQNSLMQGQAPARVQPPLRKSVPVLPASKSSGTSLVKAAPKSFDEMIKQRDSGQL